jgi:4,5-dihydroxyphthalate decarboxylase
MHSLVIRRDVYAINPWLAQSLLKAFTRAKQVAEVDLTGYCGWFVCMLPWSMGKLENTKSIMGEDFWPYGIEANRKVLEIFCWYAQEQGLTSRRVVPEELFAPNTLESWKL